MNNLAPTENFSVEVHFHLEGYVGPMLGRFGSVCVTKASGS